MLQAIFLSNTLDTGLRWTEISGSSHAMANLDLPCIVLPSNFQKFAARGTATTGSTTTNGSRFGHRQQLTLRNAEWERILNRNGHTSMHASGSTGKAHQTRLGVSGTANTGKNLLRIRSTSKHCVLGATASFGSIHGSIGIFKDSLSSEVLRVAVDDPDAGRNSQLMGTQIERLT